MLQEKLIQYQLGKINNIKVIISGGGTGGHIYPAVAIANEIKHRCPSANILFVGAEGRMEMEKVPKAGYEIIGLPVAGIQRRLTFKNFLVPFKLFSSLRKAKMIIKSFSPEIVVGVGGYASAPVLWAASKRKVPTLIQEQNSFAGLTNKILGKRVGRICVAYENMHAYFPQNKIQFTGNPVRKDILNLEGKREEGLRSFGLDVKKKTILVIGGSLGARTINNAISEGLDNIDYSNYQLIWQTGKSFGDQAKELTKNRLGVFASEFIYEMDLAYASADVVVSRAGALSVSELCLAQKPVIFVPSPNVSEDHQTKNAMALVNKNAAVLVKDADAKSELMNALNTLLGDEAKIEELKKNIALLAKPNAAEEIVNEIEKLVEA